MGLESIRVLDLSQAIRGSYCTKLLSGYGAEVIKIEKPEGGDEVRKIGPFLKDKPHLESSCLFHHLNNGKKSITLNLQAETGVRIFESLVRVSDIVIEDFSPGKMSSCGIGYESLKAICPKLILTSISYFGQGGPYCNYKATDITVEALGGYMYISGERKREPLKIGGYQAEYQAGLNGAVATMVALYCRDREGIGTHVDVSAMECIACRLCQAPQAFHYLGQLQTRLEPRIYYRSPTGPYPSTTLPCKDGYVFVHAMKHRWDSFASLVQEPRLLNPEVLDTPRGHEDEIDALMLPWLKQRTRKEIVTQAQERGHPFGPVLSINEVCVDEQHKARRFFVEVDHPIIGKLVQLGAPVEMTRTSWKTQRAPLLGEHNHDVYSGLLGYSREEIARLIREGVI